jgi:hypothetical protein
MKKLKELEIYSKRKSSPIGRDLKNIKIFVFLNLLILIQNIYNKKIYI